MLSSWNKCVHTVPAICPYHKEWLYYLFNIWVHRYTEAILTHEMRLLRNKRLSCNSSNCNSYISKRKVYLGLLQYHDATGAKLECKRQTAVTVYLKSEQLLLFAFALQHGRRTTPHYQHLEGEHVRSVFTLFVVTFQMYYVEQWQTVIGDGADWI